MAEVRRFAKFAVSGGLAALLNITLRWLLNAVISFELAVVLAYFIAMIFAFALSRLFVFEASTRSTGGQFLRFALVNLVSIVIVWSVSVGLYRILFPAIGMTWHQSTVAHVIGVLSPVFAAYTLHKKFTFGEGLR